jgi:hypothetical protein
MPSHAPGKAAFAHRLRALVGVGGTRETGAHVGANCSHQRTSAGQLSGRRGPGALVAVSGLFPHRDNDQHSVRVRISYDLD